VAATPYSEESRCAIQSAFRLVKRWKRYGARDNAAAVVPSKTRGLYALYKKEARTTASCTSEKGSSKLSLLKSKLLWKER
jgi:hypothetical protein